MQQLKSETLESTTVGFYKTNPTEGYSKIERANLYAKFLLECGNDKTFLSHCFGSAFCKMVDSLIEFNLLENGKKFRDIDTIKFYECKSARASKTIISRIKFK